MWHSLPKIADFLIAEQSLVVWNLKGPKFLDPTFSFYMTAMLYVVQNLMSNISGSEIWQSEIFGNKCFRVWFNS